MAPEVPKVQLSDGNEIPIIGLGTWKSKPGEVKQAVKDAIAVGYRHIDCALAYQNETEVGDAIREMIAAGKVTRDQLFVTDKLWNTYHKKERVIKCIEKTLANLGLDYVDLYLVHWPVSYKEGDEVFPRDENGRMIMGDVDFMETWEGMEEVHQKGLAKSIGVSNFNSQQIERILQSGKSKPVVNQIECHPYLNQKPLIEFCKRRGIVVTAYSPLGSPDRPWAKPGDPSLLAEPALKEIANTHGKTTAQVVIRYQVQRGVVVIPKSVTKKRIIENFNVFDFELSQDEMTTIDAFNRNHRFCPLDWAKNHPHYPFNIPF